MMTYVWLGITILAVIIEFATSEMVSLWFVGGGIIALILSAVGVPYYIQIPVFIVVSVVLLLLFRKFVMKKINKGDSKINAERAVGKEFKLLTPIAFNQAGSIKVDGVIWSAVTEEDHSEIETGKIVKVKGIKGNKYIVEEVK